MTARNGVTRDNVPGSFRDPSGYLFKHNGLIHRHVDPCYQVHYDGLTKSGFYESAVKDRLLVPHEEIPPAEVPGHESAHRVLLPEQLAFVSYPYEWCFSQLKDAALLTLALQQRAMKFDLTLKDASAFNVQFHKGAPTFIDTLSFEIYQEGQPWVAYQQFCKHFLAPLALMAHRHPDLGKLTRLWIDGINLDLASRLLPLRTRFRLGLLLHIHLHARSQQTHADRAESAAAAKTRHISKTGLLGIIDSLKNTISKLEWQPAGTEWGEYYDDTNYSSSAETHKAELIGQFLEQVGPASVWDLGANTGQFSRLSADRGIFTVAADIDPAAVEKNYRECRTKNHQAMLPLVMDLTNPTPSLGWGSAERMSLTARGRADLAMALALVHHLSISNNVPLPLVAQYMRSLCRHLIIEFVPKSDSQVQRLLQSREDIFPDYDEAGFTFAFANHFEIIQSEPVRDSERTLYLMKGI